MSKIYVKILTSMFLGPHLHLHKNLTERKNSDIWNITAAAVKKFHRELVNACIHASNCVYLYHPQEQQRDTRMDIICSNSASRTWHILLHKKHKDGTRRPPAAGRNAKMRLTLVSSGLPVLKWKGKFQKCFVLRSQLLKSTFMPFAFGTTKPCAPEAWKK